jgi:hypothetical protein
VSKQQTRKKDALVGKFFHTFDAQGNIKWQGAVTAEPTPGYFLVQLYDWLLGSPNRKELIHIAQMVGWRFYDDADDWRGVGDLSAEDARLAHQAEKNTEGKKQ